jgi:peptidoglycan/LPS O-acetylase OafA/YrhL
MLGIRADANKRIYGFDLLRALAIFFVIHGHGSHLLRGTMLEGMPWFKLPHGVDIFFVISGFLIGYSFIVNSNKTGGRTELKTVLNFWKRSALRILPNYFLILAINYILVSSEYLPGNVEAFPIIRFATFTQNLYYPFYDFFWESWSLAVQQWFYVLFPFVLIIYSRFFNIKYGVLIISILMILYSIYFRYSISNIEYDRFWWDVWFRKTVASRIDCIFYGVIAAWIRFYYPKIWNRHAILAFIVGIIIFTVNTLIPREPNDIYNQLFYLSVSAICISMWFPLIDRIKSYRTKFGEAITAFSILSYALYLTNLMIIQITDKHFPEFMSDYASLKYLSFIVVSTFVSWLLYIIWENPISFYGNKLLGTRKMMYKRIREDVKV